MTQNQISAAKVAEDRRHNQVTEELTAQQNAVTKQHYEFSDLINKEHYERADQASMISANANAMNAQTNKEHYLRSDQIGLITANANALNAQTNKNKFDMEYDIEYGWTGDGENIIINGQEYYNYPAGMPLSAQKRTAEIQNLVIEGITNENLINPKIAGAKASAYKDLATAGSNVLNSIVGKRGVVATIVDLID